MRPVWDEALGDRERLVLDPGPNSFDPRPDVLVVGGGAVGLATAVMCRRAGLGSVQVIERERCGAGPSGSAAGGLSPGVHSISHPAFVALARASLALHRELDAEWRGEMGLMPLDWLIVSRERIAPGTVELPGAEVVDGPRAHEIEPQLGEAGGGVWIRDQAWVHPVRLSAALARRAGSVATRVAMTGIAVRGGRVASVETTAGRIAPGAVVFATGIAPPEVAILPRVVVKGHLLATEPGPIPLKTAVASTIIVLPIGRGRLVAGGTFHPDDDSPEVREEAIAGIRDELVRLVPASAHVSVTHAWCCFRPGTPDEMPVIDRLPELANAWLSVGHYRTGLLMAPAAGRGLAAWIESGKPPAELEAFGVSRFT
jgi:glycine/D-amino acid oxidase-like deaminating enzyme